MYWAMVRTEGAIYDRVMVNRIYGFHLLSWTNGKGKMCSDRVKDEDLIWVRRYVD